MPAVTQLVTRCAICSLGTRLGSQLAKCSINEATAGTNTAAQSDQRACVIKRLSSRLATAVSKTGSFHGITTNGLS